MNQTRASRGPRQVVSPHGTVHQVSLTFVEWSPDRRSARIRYALWCGRRGLRLVPDPLRGTRTCGLCIAALATAQKRKAS